MIKSNIFPGMKIKPNYSDKEYLITKVHPICSECNSAGFFEQGVLLKPHFHFEANDMDGVDGFGFNYYDQNGVSVRFPKDKLIIISVKGAQTTLF